MQLKKLLNRVAYLEFVNDQIMSELIQTDKVLRSIGFQDGLKSVKQAAEEIYEQEHVKIKLKKKSPEKKLEENTFEHKFENESNEEEEEFNQ